MTPAFDLPVAPSGYAWWYLDALSDDGRHGLTLIAFIGSVFSPYYAWARRRGNGLADPLNHCALNVALYTRPRSTRGAAWAMTERGGKALERSASLLRIGPSAMEWNGDALTVHIDEVTAPWPSRLRGVVKLHPTAVVSRRFPLDAAGRHLWCPIAPSARVEVDLRQPAMHWSGDGYLDANSGQRPLEDDFNRWNWSRAALARRRGAVVYDVERKDGSAVSLTLEFDAGGSVQDFAPPPRAGLPPTAWRITRSTRTEATAQARVAQTLEDGPFYARSVLRSQLLGEPVTAVHESLSMSRWSCPVVQAMLPFRMPRRC